MQARKRTIWTKEAWLWLLAMSAVVVTSFATFYFGFLAAFFGPFPKDLAQSAAGFLMGLVTVLGGSFLAPRNRLVVAIVLFMLATLLGALLPSFNFVGATAGGLIALGSVGWRLHPRRTRRSTFWVGIASCAVFILFLVVVYARHLDWPARPEQLPYTLANSLGAHASGVESFHRYDLGGFLDHQWLWRIDAKPNVIALVVGDLGLHRTNAVPQQFWRMPPHYWPRSLPPGAEVFQSLTFSTDSRGSDGKHYFMVHDRTQERAFVWFKDNF
jgi:hypothetical protein